MRDLGWFLLSGLVVVFWLSFGPRVAAGTAQAVQAPPLPASGALVHGSFVQTGE